MHVAKSKIVALGLGLLWSACSASDNSSDGRRRSNLAGTPSGPVDSAGQGGNVPVQQDFGEQPGIQEDIAPVNTVGTDPNTCEIAELKADPQIPEMMIVLDRSGSMEDAGRWMPSASAVKRITQELQDKVNFGLTLFPDPANQDFAMAAGSIAGCIFSPDPQGCLDMFAGNDPACAPGVTVVPVGGNNAGNIAGVLDMTTPIGGTPTSETLESLLQGYAAPSLDPDAIRPPKYVLLVTDGQPTCPAGQGSDTTPADVDASNAAIEALAMANVPTYVIGYDTMSPGNERLAAVLDGFAQRGATGDMQHRPVEDEDSLLAELQRIAGSIASCSFDLNEAPLRPDYVLVELDGNKLLLNQQDGWNLIGDRTIELAGTACETFKNGPHIINATVQCAPVGPD